MRHAARFFTVMFTFVLIIGVAAPALASSWTQNDWSGGPTTPELQVGTWTPSYDNFYRGENVDWSASVSLLPQPLGAQVTENKITVADSYVREDVPDNNFGTATSMYVGHYILGTASAERGYVKFDLSGIPSGVTITGAKLWLYNWGYSSPGTSGYVRVERVGDDSWTEAGIKWSNQPARTGVLVDSQLVSGDNVWKSWGSSALASFVEGERAGDKVVSLALIDLEENNPADNTLPGSHGARFESKEWSSGAYSPKLEVTYAYNVFRNGWFESSIFDAGSSADWGVVTWDASTPSFGGSDTYVYSNENVKGTVTDFANEQSAGDGGAYATLAERAVAGGGGSPVTIFSNNFSDATDADAQYDSWHGGKDGTTVDDTSWKKLSSTTGAPKQGAGRLGLLPSSAVTDPFINSTSFATTGYNSIKISFIWARETNTSDTRTTTFDTYWSTDGTTWTKIDGASYAPDTEGNSKTISDLSVGSDAQVGNKPTVYIKWRSAGRGGGSGSSKKVSFDTVVITGTSTTGGTNTYDMEIRENIDGIPSAVTYTLQMRYKKQNTNDNFRIEVWNGSAWNARGDNLTSTSWTDWSYVLLGSEVIGGQVRVRKVDENSSSTAQDNLLIDYLRVRAAPWSTSIVVKLRSGDDTDPFGGGWSGWYEHTNGTENPSLPAGRYVQYRVELSTTNEFVTPVLESGSVDIEYEIIDNTPPEAPKLIHPENCRDILDNTPTFEWTTVTDPSGVMYEIWIDNDIDFSSPVYVALESENAHTLPDENALELCVHYWWRVRAWDGAMNVGEWSEEWHFHVVPIGAIGVLLMPLLMLLPFAFMLRRQNRRYRY